MFDQNNHIIWIINKIADIFIVSVLWCLLCIPIVTIGASSAALYHSVVKSVREDHAYAARSFWDSFKENLKQSLPFTLISLLFSAAFAGTIYYFYRNPAGMLSSFYIIFSLIGLLTVILVQIHAYSLIGRVHLTRKQLFSVVVRLTGRGLLRNLTLLCLFIFAVEAVRFYPPLIMGVPGITAFLISHIEEPRFRKYINY